MKTALKISIIVVAIVLVLALILCLFLPPLMAQINTDAWVKRCVGEYTLLQDVPAIHYTRKWTYQTEKSKTSLTDDINVSGTSFLKVETDSDGVQTVKVSGKYRIYEKVFDGDGEPQWELSSDILKGKHASHLVWNDQNYTFESIKANLLGTEVVFVKDMSRENCTLTKQFYRMYFTYDGLGKLRSIKHENTSYNEGPVVPENISSVMTEEYTFHSFDRAAVEAAINAAREEAGVE